MLELFDYNTSWLNPALKLVNAALYIFVAIIYYRSRRHFAGDIEKILLLLIWMGAIAAVATTFRYFDHGTMFGFTPEFSLKWFQSLGYVAQGILFLIVGIRLSKGIIPEVRQ